MTLCSIEGCAGQVRTRGWCNAHYMRWWYTGTTDGPPVARRTKGRTCSVGGCKRKHCGQGYCEGHLRRFLRHGDPGPAEFEPRQPGAVCKIEGCESTTKGGHGWCNAHYIRWSKTGDPLTPLPEKVHWWTGDQATYNAIHFRLKNERGPARENPCLRCGKPAQEWAYDHADPDERVSPKMQPFSLNLNHYQPLCRSCHRKLDGPAKAKPLPTEA